jgi:hypothetical protein
LKLEIIILFGQYKLHSKIELGNYIFFGQYKLHFKKEPFVFRDFVMFDGIAIYFLCLFCFFFSQYSAVKNLSQELAASHAQIEKKNYSVSGLSIPIA